MPRRISDDSAHHSLARRDQRAGQGDFQKLDEILTLLDKVIAEHGLSPSVGEAPQFGPSGTDTLRGFIGSSTEGLSIAELIQLGLESVAECTLWTQGPFRLCRTPIESIVSIACEYDFAAIVLTADDFIEKRGVRSASPRDNLIFELGVFTGALGRDRTFMVVPRETHLSLPSDLAGVISIDYKVRSDGNMAAALGPVCTRIKQALGLGTGAGLARERL